MARRKSTPSTIQSESDSDDDFIPSNIMATSTTGGSLHPSLGPIVTSMPNAANARPTCASRAPSRQPPGRLPNDMVNTPFMSARGPSKPALSKPVTTTLSLEKRKGPKLIGPQKMVMINVSVEPDCEVESFYVHKNFITYYSPYFNAAFNGNFAEGQSQKLKLEDTEPQVFGTFVNWLYSQDIENAEGDIPDDATLVNLWLLADKCLVPKLQNQVMRAMDKIVRDKAPNRAVVADAARPNHTHSTGTGTGETVGGARTRMYLDIVAAAGGLVPQETIDATYARMVRQDEYRREVRMRQQHAQQHLSSPLSSQSKPPAQARPPALPQVKQDPALFHRIYENTTKDSKLRAFFVDLCAKTNVADIDDDTADDYPHDMLVAIVNRLRRPDANKLKPVTEYYVSEDVPKRG